MKIIKIKAEPPKPPKKIRIYRDPRDLWEVYQQLMSKPSAPTRKRARDE